MIKYRKNVFGLNLLLRVNGSATYRAIIPALLAVCVHMILNKWPGEIILLSPPKSVGVLISAITFLLVFRMNKAYGRYWEATGAVYKMQSKWIDATIHTATYHLQELQYNKIRPPYYSKINNHHLNREFLTRDRERLRDIARDNTIGTTHTGKISSERAELRSIEAIKTTRRKRNNGAGGFLATPLSSAVDTGVEDICDFIPIVEQKALHQKPPDRITIGQFVHATSISFEPRSSGSSNSSGSSGSNVVCNSNSVDDLVENEQEHDAADDDDDDDDDDELPTNNRHPRFLSGRPRFDGNWESLFDDGKSTFLDPQKNPSQIERTSFASVQGGHTPILFLQELAHLSSLLSAVALTTLRSDVDGVASPLSLYQPGCSWPEVDPIWDQYLYDSRIERYWYAFLYFLGQGRSPAETTRYNTARPIPVIGGVSDAEIQMLQTARGPYAKTQLCFFWLSEFAVRGFEGGVMRASPSRGGLLGRTMQFLSDGMISYNEGRKIMFNPFPFPFSQAAAVFAKCLIFFIPLLMEQYIPSTWLSTIFTFLCVLVLASINEVARELENPFRNIPNELPLVTYQAEFNEAIMTIYSGFHMDSFWEPPSDNEPISNPCSLVESSSMMPTVTEATTSEEDIERTEVIDGNKSGDQPKTKTNAQLCLLVKQQGQMMTQMMNEQKRLNTMMKQIFNK